MLKVFSKTDVGLVRRNNEDYVFTDSENGLILVADGAGGHQHGEIASRLAVESCYQYLTREDYLQDTTDIAKTLIDSIAFANQQVIDYKKARLPGSDMGTTLSCVHIGDTEVSFAWMGDSRIYLYDKETKSLSQLSVDHTLYQEMVNRGEMGDSFKKHILSRMLGNNPYTRPEGSSTPVRTGNLVLVCSDGFSDLVIEPKIIDTLADSGNDLASCVNAMIELARGQGGRDNITVALAEAG